MEEANFGWDFGCVAAVPEAGFAVGVEVEAGRVVEGFVDFATVCVSTSITFSEVASAGLGAVAC